MSSNYSNYHHRQFNQNHTQPLPDPDFSFRTALPHRIQPPHLRVMPSRREMPQQRTYNKPPHYTGMGRYEQLFDQLDAAISRLESRWEAIDRRVTKLQASKATYGQQHYADFDSRRPRRRPTCWDLPSRTSACRVGEIRAPPLPEPPPQPVPELFYGPPPCGTLDSPASKHTTHPSFWPQGFLPSDSAAPPQCVYTGWQRDCQQPQNRNQPFTFPSSHTPTQPQLVLDQKLALQLVLDQQPPPSHRCSAVPPPAAAAPPPPLRSDLPLKQPSTTSTIELPPDAAPRPCQPLLPLSVKAPLSASTRQPQAGVSSSRKKELETDLHESAEKREEKLIVLNNVWNQKEIEKGNDFTAKREEEVNNIFLKTEKEIKAEALGSSLETKEKDLSMLPEKQSKIEKMEILSLVEGGTAAFEKRRLFEHEIRVKTDKSVTKKTAISNTMKILKQRGQSCAFDPGGTLRRVVVSTLRTRWILTVWELIRDINAISSISFI